MKGTRGTAIRLAVAHPKPEMPYLDTVIIAVLKQRPVTRKRPRATAGAGARCTGARLVWLRAAAARGPRDIRYVAGEPGTWENRRLALSLRCFVLDSASPR